MIPQIVLIPLLAGVMSTGIAIISMRAVFAGVGVPILIAITASAVVLTLLGAGATLLIKDVVAEIPVRQIIVTTVREIAFAFSILAERAEVSVTFATTESADVMTGMAAGVAILQTTILWGQLAAPQIALTPQPAGEMPMDIANTPTATVLALPQALIRIAAQSNPMSEME